MSTAEDVRREASQRVEHSHLHRIEEAEFSSLFLRILELRAFHRAEPHEVVRTALQLAIDQVVAEMDRRNCLILERRMSGGGAW